MQVTILGSGTNLHPRRAAAGYLVKTDNLFLMDFGPRTLSNLLKTKVDRHRIQYLLFTHYHADHFSDFITFFFDAVCHSRFVVRRADLMIIGPKGTKALFGSILRTFPSFSDSEFRVTLKEVGTRSFTIGKTRVTPVPVTHTEHQICLGYRMTYQGRTLAYSGDASYAPNLIRLCRSVDLAILDCSFPQKSSRRSPYACRGMWPSGSGSRRETLSVIAFLPDCRSLRCEKTGCSGLWRENYSSQRSDDPRRVVVSFP